MAVGTPTSRWIGVALVVTWQLLDTVDGTMARATSNRSNYGGFVDELAGMILIAFVPICIGLGLYFHPEGSIQELSNRLGIQVTYLPTYSLALGALASIAALLMRLIQRIIMVRFKLDLAKRRQSFRGGLLTLVDTVKALESLGGTLIIVLVTSVAFAKLEWYVLYYFFLSSGMLVVSTTLALFSLRHERAYPADGPPSGPPHL
jgi:phosphatidylglycerophosphate synthase